MPVTLVMTARACQDRRIRLRLPLVACVVELLLRRRLRPATTTTMRMGQSPTYREQARQT
jgi:hypothetical protein